MALPKNGVVLSTGLRLTADEFGKLKVVDMQVLRCAAPDAAAEKEKDRRWVEMVIWHFGKASRSGNVILQEAWEEAVPKFMELNPAIAIGHEMDAAYAPNIGRVTEVLITEEQVTARGYLGHTPEADKIWQNLEDEIPMQASVMWMPSGTKEADEQDVERWGPHVQHITTKMDLYHFGIVNVGANEMTKTVKAQGVTLNLSADKMQALAEVFRAGAALILEMQGELPEPAPVVAPAPESGEMTEAMRQEVRGLLDPKKFAGIISQSAITSVANSGGK